MNAARRSGVWLGIVLVFAVVMSADAWAADVPTLVVPSKATAMHVVVELPERLELESSTDDWQLVELGGSPVAVPVDVVAAPDKDGTPRAKRRRLVATIEPREGSPADRRFALMPRIENVISSPRAHVKKANTETTFNLAELSPASVEVREGDRPVLVYNYGPITNEKVPKKDGRRTRACYVHPIHGLDGEVLTDDFPRDHYHHHGLFWAWPHVQIDGKAYDLWMGRGIKLKPVRWLDREEGNQSATLGVENGWFVGDKKVMTERVWLTVHKATDDAQAVDVELTWIPDDRPITLWGAPKKSYGGATIRFAVPRKQRPKITVPTGRSRRDLAMKPLAWADLTHTFGDADKPSGAALMVSKTHPDYPPTWLTRHYGPLCIGYPGVEKKTFEPGVPFTLRYRLWIHKGAQGLERLRQAYDAYTTGEGLRWE